MALFRYRNLRQFSTILPRLLSGVQWVECGQAANLLPSCSITSACAVENVCTSGVCGGLHVVRFSTATARSKEVSSEMDLISFVKSSLDQAEGPYHCWVNRYEDSKEFLENDGAYLLIAEAFLDDSPGSWHDQVALLEKVKLLQQRYPWLHICGFQSCSSISSVANQNHLINVIVEDYISFPILLSSKIFPEVASGACCVLFKGSTDQPLYYEKEADYNILNEAIKVLNEQRLKNARNADKLNSPWSKQAEGFKEPYVCNYLRDLPLFFPACISADESGQRVFLSDSNHHRVLVFDNYGKILDVIGSFPGFEDGDFETAKLMRPAASYYHASENCLYLVDSENHSVRRADLERRVLETLYPTNNDKEESGLWSWILSKVGFRSDPGMKSVDFDQDSLLFPWHILKSEDNSLSILNRSLDTLWIMDPGSGLIRDVVRGHESIMESCGQQIMEKVQQVKSLSSDHVQQPVYCNRPFGGISDSGFVSSSVNFGKDLLICDTVGQRVLKLNKKTKATSSIQLSDFANLGLPYWLSCSLERVFPGGHVCEEAQFNHVQSFTLFPGKIDVRLVIDIPADTELVEPLQEHCVWRQARGAAMEVLSVKETAAVTEKVGVAQQWYDELDSLPFEAEPEISKEEIPTSSEDLQDGKIHINCVVNTSPGTSEVTVSAPLYLKLQSRSTSCEGNQELIAARIAEIMRPKSSSAGKDTLFHLLLKLNRDLSDLVFMKPLHVKIKFDTLNHPKAENSRDIILTDSILDVNVSL